MFIYYPHVVGIHITFKKIKSEKPLVSMANSGDELDAHLGLTTSQWGTQNCGNPRESTEI